MTQLFCFSGMHSTILHYPTDMVCDRLPFRRHSSRVSSSGYFPLGLTQISPFCSLSLHLQFVFAELIWWLLMSRLTSQFNWPEDVTKFSCIFCILYYYVTNYFDHPRRKTIRKRWEITVLAETQWNISSFSDIWKSETVFLQNKKKLSGTKTKGNHLGSYHSPVGRTF